MPSLYPLKFEPIFRPMLWGGERLPALLGRPVPTPDPVGEAWILSDVEGNLSRVQNGALAGRTLREVIAAHAAEVYGDAPPRDPGQFPLLLKILDARQNLSVQVHPDDAKAVTLKGPGHRGKTEAWVILDSDPATSRIYAGVRPGTTAESFRAAIEEGTTPAALHQFTPQKGDCVFLAAGTVHAIGADILLFEIQQTSDITFRLYDWGRADAKTGKPRELHVDDGLACADFAAGPCDPVPPAGPPERETLIACPYFTLARRAVAAEATIEAGGCRLAVVVAGAGTVGGEAAAFGDVLLLPASLGAVPVATTSKEPLVLLECGLGPQA